jgi:hypothetical protein
MNQIRDILRVEIHATADEIRRLKRWWRTPPDGRPEPPTTRFALHPSRRRATLLCMAMAHSRGRIHLRSTASLEQQAAQLLEALDAMERMKRQTPLFDAALQAAARAILAWNRRAGAARTDACVAPTAEHRA